VRRKLREVGDEPWALIERCHRSMSGGSGS
jgi:hypothetical protein